MKSAIKIGLVLLLASPFFASQSLAADSWWKKAVNVLAGTDESPLPVDLSSTEIADAFKEALSIGSEAVVQQLGEVDGFNGDPAIHIPLPRELGRLQTMLASVGMSSMVDDLELKLNRAAEAATPIARDLFLEAIADMTFEDVMTIYRGADDSATRYFREQMSASLSTQMRPIVENSLAQVGALQAFDRAVSRYQDLPFVPDVNANLTNHVIDEGMDGIFFYIAKEEAAIRENPVKQTTDLLKRVFGAN